MTTAVAGLTRAVLINVFAMVQDAHVYGFEL